MDTRCQSDSELLALFAQGSLRAFDEMYDRHAASIYHIALRILEDHELAKDVVQEVFVSFFENARNREILNLKAYLLQTAKYQCFMILRSGRISEKHLQRVDRVVICNMV